LGWAHEQRGIAHSKLREYPTAIAEFDRALRLGITTAQTPREIAVQVWQEVQHQQATTEIERQRQEEEQRWRAAEQERQRLEQLLAEEREKRQQAELLAAKRAKSIPQSPLAIALPSGSQLDFGNYNGAPIDGSAWVSNGTSNYVLCGGSSIDFSRYCRSAIRVNYAPDIHYHNIGFRVVFAPRT
jgi:hypothetical protein